MPIAGGYQFNVVHTFDGSDGAVPTQSLVMDSSGNLYSSTMNGGANNFGDVFQLSPSGENWTFADIYDFAVPSDPIYGTPALDAAGNFYDDTSLGGTHGVGTIFELSPSGGVWSYADLYDFEGAGNGVAPYGGVLLDANGNIYGTTNQGGWGNVWEFSR